MLSILFSGTKGRAENAFVLGDGAFNLPAVSVNAFGEAAMHLRAGAGFGGTGPAAAIEGDNGGRNSQVLPAKAVIVFAVVGRVGKDPVERDVAGGLTHGLGELRGVITWTTTDHCPRKEMRFGVAYDGQFGPLPPTKRPVAFAVHIVGTGVTGLQAGGIYSPLRASVDQAQLPCTLKKGGEQFLKDPFFKSRCSA